MYLLELIIEKLNAAQAAKELNKAWFVEQQQAKKNFAPKLWESLCRQLEHGCETLRANSKCQLTATLPSNSEIRLNNSASGAYVRLTFDPHTPVVNYSSPGPNGYLVFAVKEDGNGVLFQDPKDERLLHVDEVAERIIGLIT